METIKETNELIAKFMGIQKVNWNFANYKYAFAKKEDIEYCNKNIPNGWSYNPDLFHFLIWSLNYDKSYDWLMPVVVRLEQVRPFPSITYDYWMYEFEKSFLDINELYANVVKCIKEINNEGNNR